ncbi:hypothetical protein [Natrinema halophilum]|uniref:Uncharacterized protein n=1 Tax=Natrinema halophilum TaxID=1699371 RepID=A0A7D5KQW5_9EURY|nr:hypothetical protein [Natrinema halophilum]QLG47864.1 hypothetical protein HYG82_02895 [Natrinema halophilum]
MTDCTLCGMPTAPGRRTCRDCSLEQRHGVPSDHDRTPWVLGDEWHASMYFDGSRHTCACGVTVETPLNHSTEDLRYVPDKYGAEICSGCINQLEEENDSRLETLPDGGEFEPASELRADGGEVDVYEWVLGNVHKYPAGTDSRWGCRSNLVHQGRKLDGVSKDDIEEAIARAVENEDLISWHGLLARAEIDRLRELIRVEHEEHDITRSILVGKCNKLIAKKKQEQADEAEREIATDGGVDQWLNGTDQDELRLIRANSTRTLTRLTKKSRPSARKTKTSPWLTHSASISPIVHPISKPVKVVNARPRPTRRRLLPPISSFCGLYCISAQPEDLGLYCVHRSDFGLEISLQLDTEQRGDQP